MSHKFECVLCVRTVSACEGTTADICFKYYLCLDACSHFSGQLRLNEQVEQARAFNTVKLLQDSILCPEEEEDFTAGRKHQRPASPLDYTLDIDYTAAKVVNSVIEKCKLFQCLSALNREGFHELLTTLQGLYDVLLVVQVYSSTPRHLLAQFWSEVATISGV